MSGVKKFMHKIKEKMESVGEGHHQDHQSHGEKVGGGGEKSYNSLPYCARNVARSEGVLGTRR